MSEPEVPTVVQPQAEEEVTFTPSEVEIGGVTYETAPISPSDQFFAERAQQAYKQTPASLQDSLQKLITLDAALLAGSFVAIKSDVMHPTFWLAVMLCLLFSLDVAIWGAQPVYGEVRWDCADDNRKYQREVIHTKARWLRTAALALMAAFLIAVLGVSVRLMGFFSPAP